MKSEEGEKREGIEEWKKETEEERGSEGGGKDVDEPISPLKGS